MSAPPAISIIIPCYNGASYLRETLSSLQRQTILPSEIIVIDDGSTDGSAQIAESFGSLTRVIRQTNQGESAARNNGIALSTGTYILFLDADDMLRERSLEMLAQAISNREDAVACMGYAYFTECPEKPTLERIPQYQSLLPRILFESFAPPHSWLVPRRMLERAGCFYIDVSVQEDWALWQRLAVLGAELLVVPYIGALYRRHARSQTSQETNRSIARDVVVRASRTTELALANLAVIDAHGEDVFLMAADAFFKGERNEVDYRELEILKQQIMKLVGYASVRRGRTQYARFAGLVGFNTAYWLFKTKERVLRRKYPGA